MAAVRTSSYRRVARPDLGYLRLPAMRLAPCLAVLLAARAAAAQEQPGSGDVNSAASAFQEGQRLQLAREYARAAEFFEIADHSAPSPAALRSAIRSHLAAGHAVRAATLALLARDRDAADAQSAQLAASVIAESTPRLARVHVTCLPACTVSVDRLATIGGAGESHTFFAEPGTRALEVRWSGRGARSRSLECSAGQSVELSLDAPPPEPTPTPVTPPTPPVVTPPVAVVNPPPPPPPPRPARRPLSPMVFWIGLGATAVSGGLLVWSGVDTLSARDAYVQRPTEAGYNAGVGLQARTDVFIGTTAALGIATAVIGAFFTEWSGSGASERAGLRAVPTLGMGNGGPQVGVIGSF